MLEIIRSNRLEALLEALGEHLQGSPIADPMQAESIVVPSRGMERWLSQRLAHRLGRARGDDGICAHVDFPFPGRIARMALALVEDDAPLDAEDPWQREKLAWHILSALRDGLEAADPNFAELAHYLGHEGGPAFEGGVDRRAFGLASRVAQVFDRYGQHRPDIVAQLRQDASRFEGQASLQWQAALWQAVEAQIGAEPFITTQQRALSALRRQRLEPGTLPARLSFFGFASMSPALLTTFDALSTHLPCRVYILSPTAAYWADTRTRKQLLAKSDGPLSDEALALGEGHPLLASSGRIAREFQAVVEDCIESYAEGPECFVDPLDHGVSALSVLQSDLLHLRNREFDRPDAPRHPLDRDDHSIRVHACYGKLRQVEVLRESILAAMDADPSLACRDILVMSPDIESYAPLIESVFRRGEPYDATQGAWSGRTGTPRLRVNIADRLRHTRDPLVRALIDLLGMVAARRTLAEVIDLLSHELIRKRFGIAADDVDLLLDWSREAGARWGSDAAHRERFSQPAASRYTWRAALDRMALGVTMSDESGPWMGVAPFDRIEGGAVSLFANFDHFCERLFASLDALAAPRPLAQWATALEDLAKELMALDDAEAWRNQRLTRAISRLVEFGRVVDGEDLTSEESPLEVTLEVVTRLIIDGVDGGSPAIGQQGAITFCAMAPMRSIPHRMVCLLGMDHGAFPRAHTVDAFDLMAQRARLGDPQPRDADRFLFIEALLAARERFVVTYAGRDPTKGESHPPANAVRELLEHLDQAFLPPPPLGSARDHVLVTEHLHGHDARYFESPGQSFDAADLEAAKAWQARGEHGTDRLLPDTLEPAEFDPLIDLDELIRTLTHPARAHVQQRLAVYLFRDEDPLPQREPLELDGLERYGLKQELLALDPDDDTMRFAQQDRPAQALRDDLAQQARLPPGTPGDYGFNEALAVRNDLQRQLEAFDPEVLRRSEAQLRVELDDGSLVTGRIQVNGKGQRILLHHRAELAPKYQLGAWIEHLAWQASCAEPVSSLWITPDRAKPKPLPQISQSEARARLAELVALSRRNLDRPLPFFPDASLVFVNQNAKQSEEGALESAARRYKTDSNRGTSGEGHDAYNELLWGDAEEARAPRRDPEFGPTALTIWGPPTGKGGKG